MPKGTGSFLEKRKQSAHGTNCFRHVRKAGGAREINPGGVQHWSAIPDSEPATSLVTSIKLGTAARQSRVPEVFCSCQSCQVVRARGGRMLTDTRQHNVSRSASS